MLETFNGTGLSMTDREKILAEIERLMKENVEHSDGSPFYGGRSSAFGVVYSFINSLSEEPVSEDLEKAAVEAFKNIVDSDKNNFLEVFKAGAEWQKEIDSKAMGVSDKAYFESCEKIRKQTIKKACEWWERNDSYAVPTNIQIERFKQEMEEEV